MGDPGARKTTLLLRLFPNLHIFDCDHNLGGPEKICREGLSEGGKIVVPPLKKDLSYSYDDCRMGEDNKPLEIDGCFDRTTDLLKRASTMPEYQPIKNFGLDSLSHVNEFIVRKVLKLKGKQQIDVQIWSDFATQAYTLLVARLDALLLQGKNVICTCHQEKISQPDATNIMMKKIVEVNPLFSGRVGDSIGAFFTDVWRIVKKPGVGGKAESFIETDVSPLCSHLKNSLGLPAEVNITKDLSILETYLKGRI